MKYAKRIVIHVFNGNTLLWTSNKTTISKMSGLKHQVYQLWKSFAIKWATV